MGWISRIRALIGIEKLAREHDEELEFHLAMREQLNVDLGMTQAEARRDARRRFGNPILWRERMSEIDLLILPHTLLMDLRYGARMLRRNVGFTLAAVLALGLGIGVNTAVFTSYKAFFHRSLDAHETGRMVNLALMLRAAPGDQAVNPLTWFSIPDYESYRDQMRSFNGLIAASNPQYLTLTGAGGVSSHRAVSLGSLLGIRELVSNGDPPETASTFLVSENYFSVLGIGAIRGRTFAAGEFSKASASPSALISENYWQKRFAGDPGILGKTIRLNGAAFTIVGITPHNFVGTTVEAPDFWLPLTLEPLVHPDDDWLHNRENLCCRLFARLAPGVSIDQVQAEMTALAAHLRTLHDPHSDFGKAATAVLWPGSPFPYPLKLYGGLGYASLLIMAAVGMVLLIACANVASLQLARAASRQSEMGVRLSLGASRGRIVRQLLTESALLSLIAGAVALVFSWAFLQVVVVLIADAFPAEYGTFIFHVTPDLGIFAYVFCLSLVSGILFGLAPALESSAAALSSATKGSSGTVKIRSRRTRNFLTAAQVAVSLTLLIAGSMLIRSSVRALKMDTGYDSKRLVSLELRFPDGSNYRSDRQTNLVRELRTRLAAVPGVTALTSARAPDGDVFRTAAVSLSGDKPSPQNTRAILYYTYVQPNYFQTLGIPLLLGRGFQEQGRAAETAVILSESAAQLLWPKQNPIGRSLRLAPGGNFAMKGDLSPDAPAYEVIGVARDTRGVLLDGTDAEQIYVPMPEDRLQEFPILIRTQADPAQIMKAIGTTISSVDPNLLAFAFTLEDMLRQTESFLASSLSAAIALSVGILGLFLASMGIYGTVSYIVVLRTREVGIRMALGAKQSDVLLLMLRESIRPVASRVDRRNMSRARSCLFAARSSLRTPLDRWHFPCRCLASVSEHCFARGLHTITESNACRSHDCSAIRVAGMKRAGGTQVSNARPGPPRPGRIWLPVSEMERGPRRLFYRSYNHELIMAATLAQFADLCQSLASTGSKLQKRALMAEYLRSISVSDAGVAALYLAGIAFAETDRRELKVGGALLSRVVLQLSGASPPAMHAAYLRHGDLGGAAEDLLQARSVTATLTLSDVEAAFAAIADAGKPAAKQHLCLELLRKATPVEAKFLLKIVLGDMRTGVQVSLVEEAIAAAYDRSLKDVRRARMLNGNLCEVLGLAAADRLVEAKMKLFHPLGFMLASPVETVEEALDRFSREIAEEITCEPPEARPDRPVIQEAQLEDKYDGVRAQIHCGSPEHPGRVEIFSRSREDMTASFPEIVEAFSTFQEPLVLDGELLAWRPGGDTAPHESDTITDRALPFSSLQSRLGRKRVTANMRESVPIVFMAFDVLFANGDMTMEKPLLERRRVLEALVQRMQPQTRVGSHLSSSAPQQTQLLFEPSDPTDGFPRLVLARAVQLESVEQLEQAYVDARARGNEGVMLKARHSTYQPGRRGLAWLKLKRELATLDVVVTAAEYGHGRKAGWLSDYTFAVRDGDTLRNVGKAYSGVTDAEIAQLTRFFLEHTLEDFGGIRSVEPLVVLEVAFNNVMRSDRHDSGFALRFPRILRIREDKPAGEIDTLERVEEIYNSQPDKPVEVTAAQR